MHQKSNHTLSQQPYQKNRKLWKTYALLKPKEKKKFEAWLSYELTAKQENILDLFRLLDQNKGVDEMFYRLFPDKEYVGSPFNNSFFRKLESQLIFYMEEFLAINAFRKKEIDKEIVLAQEYNRRGVGELLHKKLYKIKRKIEASPMLDAEHYRALYQIETELQKYLHKHQIKGKGSLAKSLSSRFDDWWLHEKLKLATNDLNHLQVKGEKIPTLFIQEILQLIEENEHYGNMPLLKVYKRLYLLLTGEENPDEIKAWVIAHKDQLSEQELKDIFTLLFNYHALVFNQHGGKRQLEELLHMFEWGIEDKLIFRDAYLPWDMYKNLITVTLRLGLLDKALDSLHKYKKLLPRKDQEEAFRFNFARYLFERKEFGEIIQHLNQRFSNIYYELPGRLILCRTHYELGQSDHLETELRSLRVFISRQKDLSPQRKKVEINQVKLFEQLCRVHSKEGYEKLREKILHTQPLAEKKWLLEKVDGHLVNI